MIYTGIGSRKTPKVILQWMESYAALLATRGLTLRSGGAPGADQAFERGAASVPGVREIFLPWETFEREARAEYLLQPGYVEYLSPHPEAYTIAATYHPNWKYLKFGAKMLHARNVHQVLGWDLNTPTDFVICWTEDGRGGGGTGQALRIAKAHDIPIYDLGRGWTRYEEDRIKKQIEEKINDDPS